MLLNNDTLVARDAFGALHDALARVPSAGLVTGTIFERDGHTVWYAGGSSLPLRALVLHEYAIPADDAPRETEFISGCAMVISRDAYERVGPLAECYFPLYMEDAEYSWRAKAAGFPVIYAPAMRIVHKVGATVGAASASPRVSYCQNRHRAFYVRRNMRGLQRLGALGYLAITKPGRAVVETLRGRPSIGWAILRGTAAGFVSDEAYSPRDPTPR
jgi:GT2 family glycosyltransferase